MRSMREAAEYSRNLTSAGDVQITPERSPENQEWIWMVAEDPAFYLANSAISRENAGG
ncbi:MAG TPA: hypothetical protein VHM69_12615 [Rubrobacter sp.]|nr:hypothetical protein [Rubrobacter sp.]